MQRIKGAKQHRSLDISGISMLLPRKRAYYSASPYQK
jgi:hypothetical protein